MPAAHDIDSEQVKIQKCKDCDAAIVSAGCEGETKVIQFKEHLRNIKDDKHGWYLNGCEQVFNFCPECGSAIPTNPIQCPLH